MRPKTPIVCAHTPGNRGVDARLHGIQTVDVHADVNPVETVRPRSKIGHTVNGGNCVLGKTLSFRRIDGANSDVCELGWVQWGSHVEQRKCVTAKNGHCHSLDVFCGGGVHCVKVGMSSTPEDSKGLLMSDTVSHGRVDRGNGAGPVSSKDDGCLSRVEDGIAPQIRVTEHLPHVL